MTAIAGMWRGGGTCCRSCWLSRDAAIARGSRLAVLLGRILALSGLLAALHLSASLYVLAVYDAVLPSGRVADLAVLTGLVVLLHMTFAALDLVRARMVCRAGAKILAVLDRRVFDALRMERGERGFTLLDDVERIRRFLAGAGPCALFDLIWAPAFLVALFLLHPALGLFASVGVLLLAGLAVATDARERGNENGITRARHGRHAFVRHLLAVRCRSGAGDHALCPDTHLRWHMLSRSYCEAIVSPSDRVLCAGALAKALRLVLQSAGFGLGALLVIEGVISVGALFVSSLVLARTFACLDGALQNWRGLVAARESYHRIIAASPAKPACDPLACLVSDCPCESSRFQPIRS